MYEKKADVMESLRNAKDSVAEGASNLLKKIKGSSVKDLKNEAITAVPESVKQTADELSSQPMGELADKATKALSSIAKKPDMDTSPSKLSYLPVIGGYLGGLAKPAPGRGRLVSSVGEGVTGNIGGAAGGLVGGIGGATLGGLGTLILSALSKGKIRPNLTVPPAGYLAGGLAGSSLGTHAGAGLFHDIAAKPEKAAELIGAQEKLDVNDNNKVDAADLAALRKGKKPVKEKAAELIGNQEELDVNDNDKIDAADLAALRKGKKPVDNKTKAAEWTPAPTFSSNVRLPHKPNPLAGGKKPSTTKADASGVEQALAKLGSQDNASPARSAAGESKGVKYKQQNEDHATGTAAFDSLEKYTRMAKKAGLNDFQSNFFGRLIQEGRNEQEIYAAVKQAGDQFGAEIGKELKRGLKKLGFAGLGALGKGLAAGGKALMGNSGNIAKLGVGGGALAAGTGVGIGAAKMPGAIQEGMTQAAPSIGTSAANTAMDRISKIAPGKTWQGAALQKLPSQFSGMVNQVLQRLPFQMGNQTTGGFAGPYKQSSEKRAFKELITKGLPALGKYMGIAGGVPGRAIKGIYTGARNAGKGVGEAALEVAKNPAIQGRVTTGFGTGAMNPYTGLLRTGDENEGWGNYLSRSALSGLAGAGLGAAGGKGTQELMRRMNAGAGIGGTGDFVGSMLGYDTNNLGARTGFLGAGLMPAALPKGVGSTLTRWGGGGNTSAFGPIRPGKATTSQLLENMDPIGKLQGAMGRQLGKGYQAVRAGAPGAFDATKAYIKANPAAAGGLGLGAAGLGTGIYQSNKLNDQIASQMRNFRNETNNHLAGIRQDLGGGMGGIGQFFDENKHWLMPALLAGGGMLAGGALGGNQGAALGGISLPALYMMHQSGMFGGGGGGGNPNPLHAPERPDLARQQQQYEQEQVNKQVAERNRDPRLNNPTAKKAGDRVAKRKAKATKS